MLLKVFLSIASFATTGMAVTHQYLISNYKMRYNEVKDFCHDQGGWPAVIDRENLLEATRVMVDNHTKQVYVGRNLGKYMKNPAVYLTRTTKKVYKTTRGGSRVKHYVDRNKGHVKSTGGKTKRYALCQARVGDDPNTSLGSSVVESGSDSGSGFDTLSDDRKSKSYYDSDDSSDRFVYRRRKTTQRSKSRSGHKKSSKSHGKSRRSKSSRNYKFNQG